MTELSSVLHSISEPRDFDLTLLLGLEQHTLLFVARNQDKKKIFVRIDSTDLEQELASLKDIGSDFEEIRVITDSPEVTLVPDGLFDSTQINTYLDICFGQERGRAVQTHHLSALGLQSVFGIKQTELDLISDIFPQASYLHIRDVLIMSTWSRLSPEAGLDFSAHLQDKRLAILVFEGKQLIQCTQYEIGDPTDIVYHCLNAMETHNAEYKTVSLHCSGNLSPNNDAFELLRAYCPEAIYEKAGAFESQYQEFFILAQHHLCVS